MQYSHDDDSKQQRRDGGDDDKNPDDDKAKRHINKGKPICSNIINTPYLRS